MTYRCILDLRETERGIKWIKDRFERRFAEALNLTRVSAPLVVKSGTGVNDELDGVQKPVGLAVRALGGQVEIVQSLAKWKRVALADYGFERGEGLYTDMNAIRPDETLDALHSVYVDQWDWEVAIGEADRNAAFLRGVVERIYGVIRDLERDVCAEWPELGEPVLPASIHVVHSQDLEDRWPGSDPRERETHICREQGAVFVAGIGQVLRSGRPHDARAADYDDWITESAPGKPGLNGDILVWNPVLEAAFELSSMGIRVNADALREQLRLHGEADKIGRYFHRRVLEGRLPLSVGGGIGQSRLCMFLLRKAHVGEVQAGVWPDDMLAQCRACGIRLL
ncbi:MAG: aspartate--ammonia ligase [Lentisphaerae bacterium]|nr:aspartate--ammonia ligase [Lentisphaerota bacterium]